MFVILKTSLKLHSVCEHNAEGSVLRNMSLYVWVCSSGQFEGSKCVYLQIQEGLFNCLTLKMTTLLSFGALGTANQTALRCI
jgi:hypothetical protein